MVVKSPSLHASQNFSRLFRDISGSAVACSDSVLTTAFTSVVSLGSACACCVCGCGCSCSLFASSSSGLSWPVAASAATAVDTVSRAERIDSQLPSPIAAAFTASVSDRPSSRRPSIDRPRSCANALRRSRSALHRLSTPWSSLPAELIRAPITSTNPLAL